MKFTIFKQNEIACDVLKRAIQLDIDQCHDWGDYRKLLLAGRREDFVERVEMFSSKCSTSERAVLCAALAAADYVWLANEISGGLAWSLIEDCDQSTRRAVAAAIMAV